MLPYPPSTKPMAAENSLLRVLGGVLALMSILLTLLGIILHQRLPDLILAVIVGVFALRVLILWLGDKPQQHQPFPVRSPMDTVTYTVQSPQAPQGHSAQYVPPYAQSQPLYQIALEQHNQQIMPMPPTEVAPLLKLPRSVRPQQPPNASALPDHFATPPQVVPRISLSQPTSFWLPPPHASVPMSSLAPVSRSFQEGNWQHGDGEHFTQQQRGNVDGTA